MNFEGIVRGVKSTLKGANHQVTLGDYGEMLTSQLLPNYAKMLGQIFVIETFATAGVAPTAAPQTTAPKWLLYNANPEGGKSLVLLDERGRFKARLEGPVTGNILLRQAQHQCAANPGFALGFADSP